MNTQEARKILGVFQGDDSREIKRKYHKMISLFHPDSVSDPGTENIRHAQEINEAYRILNLAYVLFQKVWKNIKKTVTVPF